MGCGVSIRPVSPEEVAMRIDDEVRLVSLVAAILFTRQWITATETAGLVDAAYKIVDEVIQVKEQRLMGRMEKEARRRRGY